MSIHLNRKKILCITFFLCCILPACFTWFENEAGTVSGLSTLELPLLIATTLFAFALLFERPQFILPLGILSHLLLLAFLFNSFLCFPVISSEPESMDLAESFRAVRPAFWISFGLLLFHMALFTTTEIAVRKLKKQSELTSN